MKPPLSFLVLVTGCLIAFSSASLAKELKVGIYPFAPYFTVADDGRMGGKWKETLERKLKVLGYQAHYSHFPPPRLAKNIIQGKTDLTISAHHVAVDGHVHYSKLPVDEIILNAYHKRDRPDIKSIAELKGKNVIIIRGYAYNGRIKKLRDPANGINLIEAVSHIQAVKRLQNGNADYLLDYHFPVEDAMKATFIDPKQFNANEISRYSVYFVVSKKTEGAEKLIGELNGTLYGKSLN